MSDDDPIPSLAEALTEIRRLRARIAELEANAAITFGTLEQPTPDWPTTIEHNIPPNAPPHGEHEPFSNAGAKIGSTFRIRFPPTKPDDE